MNELTLKDKVDNLWELENSKKPKKKEMRMPGKGKVSKSKVKKGFISIARIDDNRNVTFEKKKVEEGTYRLTTGDYHTTNEKDIFFYKGKPFIFQATKKLNPYNPLTGDNETYGQKMVMARMIGDTIKTKAKGGSLLVGIGIIIAVVVAINYFGGA